jgi:hypothetical protein
MTTDSNDIRTEADDLGDERSGAGQIDIWQTNRQAFDLVRRFGEEGYLGTGRLKQIAADLGNLSRN